MLGMIKVPCCFLSLALLSSCASAVPPARINSYVSPERNVGGEAFSRIEPRPIQAGLVLIPDTADPAAAPNLPDEAILKLGETLRQELERAIPVKIKEILPIQHIEPTYGDWSLFVELAEQRGVEYLALVVLSSTEQEYPVTLFLGWTTHAQPGLRRDNWSLLEFALLDVRKSRTLMQGEARGWATLDRQTAPGISQWYPVIYLRPQDPERRIWPPTYEGAPITLRVVSFDQAAKRLAGNLLDSWIAQLENAGETGF